MVVSLVRKQEKYINTIIFICACLNFCIPVGLSISTATFLPDWLESFKGSRAYTALISSLSVSLLFGFGIGTGIVVEKFGLMISTILGSLITSIGFLVASFANGVTYLILMVGLVSGIGSNFIYIASIVAVSTTYGTTASLYLCIHQASASLGVSVFPYLANFLRTLFGWRGALMLYAGIVLQTLVIGYIMTRRMVNKSPKNSNSVQVDQHNSAQVDQHNSAQVDQHSKPSVLLRLKSICHIRFIFGLITSFSGFTAVNGFIAIIADFSAPIIDDNGVSFLSTLSITFMVTNAAFGFVNKLPYCNSTVLLSICNIITGISLIVLSYVTTHVYMATLIVCTGVGYGGVLVMSPVHVLDVIGVDNFPIAVGILSTFKGLSSVVGGFFYGMLYDVTKSYELPLLIIGSACILCSSLPMIGMVVSKRINKTQEYTFEIEPQNKLTSLSPDTFQVIRY